MNRDDAEEYTQALGQVVAGGWRQIALGDRLGVPKALGLSVDQWVQTRLGGYVKLSIAERRQAVAELANDGKKNTEIAAVLGVDEITIRRDRASTNVDTTPESPSVNSASATNVDPLDVIATLAADQELRDEVKRDERREQREADRDRLRAERPSRPAPPGRYHLIYADPPWQYEHVETENRAIENQYPTMTLEAICARTPPAADDAVLFLWATSPKLAEAMTVIDAWGFTYRTCAVWDKERQGMGYYFRQQHELLLVAARGTLPVPAAPARVSSVIRVRRGPHSEKPAHVYDLLEMMYPTFTEHDRIELFSRGDRPGWTHDSNEPDQATK